MGKVLAIGDSSFIDQIAPGMFDDHEIIEMQVVPEGLDDNSFDGITVAFALEKLPREVLDGALKHLFDATLPGGEAVFVTHSLEWASANILARDTAEMSVAYNWIYGNMSVGQHLSGYTLPILRASVRSAGWMVKHATQVEVQFPVGDKLVGALNNMVVGYKPE